MLSCLDLSCAILPRLTLCYLALTYLVLSCLDSYCSFPWPFRQDKQDCTIDTRQVVSISISVVSHRQDCMADTRLALWPSLVSHADRNVLKILGWPCGPLFPMASHTVKTAQRTLDRRCDHLWSVTQPRLHNMQTLDRRCGHLWSVTQTLMYNRYNIGLVAVSFLWPVTQPRLHKGH